MLLGLFSTCVLLVALTFPDVSGGTVRVHPGKHFAVAPGTEEAALVPCPGSTITQCCRFEVQHDSRCTFGTGPCSVWHAVEGISKFTTVASNVASGADDSDREGTPPYAMTQCGPGAPQYGSIVASVFQSEQRAWGNAQKTVKLSFRHLIPAGTQRDSVNMTVAAVLAGSHRVVPIVTVSASRHESWITTKLTVPVLREPYVLRFTAYSTCDRPIALDDIVLTYLTATDEIACIPTTTTTTTTTPAPTTTTTTPAPTPRPVPVGVRVKLVSWSYSDNGEACDFFWGKCDPTFYITYKWSTPHGEQTASESFDGGDDTDSTSFSGHTTKVLTTPLPGTMVTVVISVYDRDRPFWEEYLGLFRFSYEVLYSPSASVDVPDSYCSSGNYCMRMKIGFTPFF